MILVLSAVTLPPLLIVGFVLQSLGSSRLLLEADNALLTEARGLTTQTDAFLRRGFTETRRGALLPIVKNYLATPAADRLALRDELTRLLTSLVVDDAAALTSCAILDLSGVNILDTAGPPAQATEAETLWFREALRAGQPVVRLASLAGEPPSLWFATPIRDIRGENRGVFRLRCALASFRQNILRLSDTPGPALRVALFDESSRVITQSEELRPVRALLSTATPSPDEKGEILLSTRWSDDVGASARDDRIALLTLKTMPWRLAVAQPGEIFLAPILELRRSLLLFGLFVVTLALVGVVVAAHRLSGRIVEMSTAVQRVADGDLSTAVAEKGRGEFAAMARAFNRMTGRLRTTQDSVERHIAQVQASEQRLRELIDAAPFGIAITNTRLEILHLNRKFTELFGYTRDDFSTIEAWWPLAYPDPVYREQVRQDWQLRTSEAIKFDRESAPFEAVVTCKDGSRRLVEFRWRATHADQRITVLADMTGHRAAEDALRHSEERHRLLLDHAPEAIVVLDADQGRFVDCNPAAESLFKLPRSELLRRGPIELSPPIQPDGRPSAEAGRAAIAEAVAGQLPVFEWIHCDATGETIQCELRLLRLPDVAGRRLVRGSIVNISARKRAEDSLRESEERFRLLVENSTELVAQINSQGTYLYASPNHLSITGYPPDLLVGTSVFNYIHPEDLPRVREALHDDHAVRQYRYRYQDGSWHWFESAGRRFRTSSGAEMGAVVSRDVTSRVLADEARKRLEGQLRQAQKMEAIGTLAGGIAHDFNNILTGILGSTQLAEHELAPGHPARKLLSAAVKASLRARDLVSKILTFSRHREQQHAVHPLGPIIQEALGLLRASLPATIHIRVEIAADPIPVICDPVQIHQIVMNLGTNAAQAMQPRGGLLTVALDPATPTDALRVEHPKLPAGRFACLTVRDTGSGMDAETRERIFEPFFTTKPVGQGTGLGLAVVHGIVEDHQGAIIVDSKPGGGTTFQIWLPTVGQEAPSDLTAPSQFPRGQGQRVYFVDDEPSVAEVGARILNSLGYQAVPFVSPTAALAEFCREPDAVAAVISDLTMPELSGAEFIRALRTTRPELPVLVITGYMRSGEVERVRALGIRHFMPKPFSLQSLAEALRQALRKGI
jgi:PAS domain S-box-containing protein